MAMEVIMPKVRALKAHSRRVGVGIYRRGEVYDEFPLAAEQKVAMRLVEYVMKNKSSPILYPPTPLTFIRAGNWFVFSDGEKVLGKRKAAEKLGVTVEELEAADVNSDNG
jgi:hypothetical protein